MKKLIGILITLAVGAVAAFFAVGLIRDTYSEGIASYDESINAAVEARRAELLENSVFHNGVVVNDVSIGGMTYEEALKALKPVEDRMVEDVGFTLHYNDETTQFPLSFFNVEYDTKQILGDAIMLASEGEPELVQQQIDRIAAEGRYYSISCTVTPKENLISSKIYNIASYLFENPVNASFEANPDSVYVDPKAYEGIEDPTTLPDYVSPDRFIYHEGKTGRTAYPQEAIDEILARTESGDYGDVVMRVETTYPEITLDNIEDKIVMRSHFESSYASGSYGAPNRLHNVKKACGLVNGTCVPPADPADPDSKVNVFSTNDCLGYRTLEDGWLPAPGFVDGGARSEDSPGGGVCHVSSTLYNAVIKADLKIVYRINHSSHVGYVDWGLDATIDSGRIDFKWANNTEHNVYVFMWVDTKKKLVCCEIWGEAFPEEFDSIEFYSEFLEEIPPGPTEYVQTNKLTYGQWYYGNSAKTGYKYQSYKQYMKDGKKVGEPVKVAFSEYKMHPVRVYVWVGYNGEALLSENYYKPPADENNGN